MSILNLSWKHQGTVISICICHNRQTKGRIESHLKEKTKTPTYSAIWKRVNKLNIKMNPKLGRDIIIAIDNTGIKVAGRGVLVDETEMAKKKRVSQNSCGSRCEIKTNYRN